MFDWFPPDRYQMRQIKFYGSIIGASLLAILILGNAITALVRDNVKFPKDRYVLKEGFPLVSDQNAYVRMVRNYPHDPGVKIRLHTMREGESYWDVAAAYNITVDTIIGANPTIDSLKAKKDTVIVVPREDGLLLAIDDVFDVRRMKKLLRFKGKVRGEYLPGIFRIFSTDDIRLVFLKDTRPLIVNNSLEKLYRLRNIYQTPVKGKVVSLYGERADPFEQSFIEFHNGIDIQARTGTPIRPTREGLVIYTGWRDGYGLTVIVQHEDGYLTIYGHCSVIKTKVGEWVEKDKVISLVGSTGRTTGPHLHFVVMRHGFQINPIYFVW